jgi:hypothetical protein
MQSTVQLTLIVPVNSKEKQEDTEFIKYRAPMPELAEALLEWGAEDYNKAEEKSLLEHTQIGVVFKEEVALYDLKNVLIKAGKVAHAQGIWVEAASTGFHIKKWNEILVEAELEEMVELLLNFIEDEANMIHSYGAEAFGLSDLCIKSKDNGTVEDFLIFGLCEGIKEPGCLREGMKIEGNNQKFRLAPTNGYFKGDERDNAHGTFKLIQSF